VRAYRAIIERFIQEFGDGPVEQVTPEQILTYLNRLTEGNKPYTKRIRYSQLSSFFNFVRNNIDPELLNPCDRPMIRKLYRERVPLRWKIIEKETIDEIIFRTTLQVCNAPSDRIFPISYEAARIMVIKSGKLVGVKLVHTICVGIPQPMHLDLAYLLKLFQKSSSGTQIFRPHSVFGNDQRY
jgi:hypothetical protein